jgi:hypothetical protein
MIMADEKLLTETSYKAAQPKPTMKFYGIKQ